MKHPVVVGEALVAPEDSGAQTAALVVPAAWVVLVEILEVEQDFCQSRS